MAAIPDPSGVIASYSPSFLEISDKVILKSNTLFRNLSFIEAARVTTNKKMVKACVGAFGVVPIFMFKPNMSGIPEFDGKTEITGVGMPNEEATKNLTET